MMPLYSLQQRMKKKIKSNMGDSIAEVLIALLIAAVALVMLASMINASANMITRSATFMNNYYSTSNTLNTKTGATSSDAPTKGIKVELTFPAEEGATPQKATKTYSVLYQKEELQNETIVSFWKKDV